MTRRTFKQTKRVPRYGIFDTDEDVELYKDYLVDQYTKDDLKLSLLQLVKRENLRGIKIHYTQALRILRDKGIRLRRHRRFREKSNKTALIYLEEDTFYTLEKYDIPMAYLVGKLTRCFLGLDSPDTLFVYLDDRRPIMFIFKQTKQNNNHLGLQIIAPSDITQTEESLLRAVGEMSITEPAPIEFIKTYFKRIDRPCYGGTIKQLGDPKDCIRKK